MDFDWKPLAGAIIQAGAPVIGGALLGPIGSAAGSMLGGLLASALGVEPTPEAVGNAIQTRDPATVADALARADSEAVAKWDAIARISIAQAADRTAQAQAINETVRAEAAAGVSWWHWRHLLGYLVLLYGLEQVAAIAYAMFGKGIQPSDLAALFNATAVFTGGLFALLGYVAADTTALKQTAMTGEAPPTVAGAIVKAVLPKKK